ncbi:PREDICTED: pyridoxine-5'-phosphate oxidase [Ceratosolen solmsi marchali]|uniref:pyridoxal 5'-phosphate synthase n=1 Tax=Ceratosolen solmsi marchali TaxID=326594 RepID=A0AAJ6VLD8_9HYME|nr:PREDICTED: pyridoxine-5'-phosphate oxidase [Ceratosolen solmsi marchali]
MANFAKKDSNRNSHTCNVDIGDMRIKYKDKSETFTEDQLVSKDPLQQFKAWFEIACKTSTINEPNAVLLGTATKDGKPSVRPVLLKGFSSDGFKFYTNYESRKAQELAENPCAALTFFWDPLCRTVRIEGTVTKTSIEDSDQYFNTRPYYSQIGSLSSKQSTVIPNREFLIIKEKELQKQFPNNVKRPDWWGGYIVVPKSIEFWQGQSDRLHDRIKFRRLKVGEKPDNILVHQGDNGWVYERLSP